jgi:holo-[acyl-carrier protein] synthase
MILGVGSDLIDVRRIERTIDRHGERFLARIFTATERAKADGRARRAETYAKRFAAKEACAKALGTGLRAGVFWRDMGVVNLPSGRPTMKLTGGALARLNAITPAGCEARIDVSVTDEGPMAQAVVVISAVPRASRSVGSASPYGSASAAFRAARGFDAPCERDDCKPKLITPYLPTFAPLLPSGYKGAAEAVHGGWGRRGRQD